MNQMAPIGRTRELAAEGIVARLKDVIAPGRVMTDPLMTYAYSGDASSYRLVPAVVVIVNTEDEVRAVIAAARAEHLPLTFRAAGTSLQRPGHHRRRARRARRRLAQARRSHDERRARHARAGDHRRPGQPRAQAASTRSSAPIPPARRPARSAASSTTTRPACAAASPTTPTTPCIGCASCWSTARCSIPAMPHRSRRSARATPRCCDRCIDLHHEVDGRPRTGGADQEEIPDQEHRRLFAQCAGRFPRPDRHPDPPDRRLRRHARLRLRGDLQHHPRAPLQGDGADPLPRSAFAAPAPSRASPMAACRRPPASPPPNISSAARWRRSSTCRPSHPSCRFFTEHSPAVLIDVSAPDAEELAAETAKAEAILREEGATDIDFSDRRGALACAVGRAQGLLRLGRRGAAQGHLDADRGRRGADRPARRIRHRHARPARQPRLRGRHHFRPRARRKSALPDERQFHGAGRGREASTASPRI